MSISLKPCRLYGYAGFAYRKAYRQKSRGDGQENNSAVSAKEAVVDLTDMINFDIGRKLSYKQGWD